MQERHWRRYLAVSPEFPNHRVRGYREDQFGNMTQSNCDSLLVRIFVHFRHVMDWLRLIKFSDVGRSDAAYLHAYTTHVLTTFSLLKFSGSSKGWPLWSISLCLTSDLVRQSSHPIRPIPQRYWLLSTDNFAYLFSVIDIILSRTAGRISKQQYKTNFWSIIEFRTNTTGV